MNSNHLAGMRCPKCKSEGPFRIKTRCTAIVHDDGIDETHDHEWDSNSFCACWVCRKSGTVRMFTKKSKERKL